MPPFFLLDIKVNFSSSVFFTLTFVCLLTSYSCFMLLLDTSFRFHLVLCVENFIELSLSFSLRIFSSFFHFQCVLFNTKYIYCFCSFTFCLLYFTSCCFKAFLSQLQIKKSVSVLYFLILFSYSLSFWCFPSIQHFLCYCCCTLHFFSSLTASFIL